jgi:hypothetical protein
MRVTFEADRVFVHSDDAPLLHYRYGNSVYKPYVKELFTPSGLNVLLDAPPDHVHHHGLMFACVVDGVDFWAEPIPRSSSQSNREQPNSPGVQAHEEFSSVIAQYSDLAHFWERITWVPQGTGRRLLIEHRKICAGYLGEPKATVLTWECDLLAPKNKDAVVLSGSHYHGLGMRFIRSMDAVGEFRNADGKPGVIFRGEERLVRSKWCAYTAPANGKVVTVAMFGNRMNSRHPTTWFMMAKPFAYLSATLGLHEEPLNWPSDRGRLTLEYGVALWDGRVETADIDRLYRQWAAQAYHGGKPAD